MYNDLRMTVITVDVHGHVSDDRLKFCSQENEFLACDPEVYKKLKIFVCYYGFNKFLTFIKHLSKTLVADLNVLTVYMNIKCMKIYCSHLTIMPSVGITGSWSMLFRCLVVQ